ncbi:MAG: methylglyoxal synthase [Hyphomicrobiales bacterium]|nr:MAG: methylglyoxal synthase [Hyphomicrobiales bacterium]
MPLTIGMVAHDRKKTALARWAEDHALVIGRHRIVATATTGSVLQAARPDLAITLVKSGPLGGDQQIGAMIAQGELDVLIFFPDPLEAQPHDVDVKALLRLVLVYDIPAAFSPSTADALAASGLLDADLELIHATP